MNIHSTSIVSNKAVIDKDVIIGPYCTIDDNVTIKSKTKLISHVNITGNTYIDSDNIFHPFTSIGSAPQDLKYDNEDSFLKIGKNNTFREHVTVNIGTKGGGMNTNIGNNCLFMVSSHIAHDCIISDNVILANNATLAGHVNIGNNSIIGGLSAIHQFVRIGKYAMIGGMSGVEQDIIPYGLYTGIRSNLRGLNLIGLKRKGIAKEKLLILKKSFEFIFNKKNSLVENTKEIKKQKNNINEVNDMINFILDHSSRGICNI